MSKDQPQGLSRRERQILDILHRLGRTASAAQVREALPDPPTYTAVNTMLRLLVQSGHIKRVQKGKQYLYFPTQPRKSAARSAIQQLVQTFFGGNIEQAMTTMLSEAETDLTDEQLERLAAAIERVKETEGRIGNAAEGSVVSREGEAE